MKKLRFFFLVVVMVYVCVLVGVGGGGGEGGVGGGGRSGELHQNIVLFLLILMHPQQNYNISHWLMVIIFFTLFCANFKATPHLSAYSSNFVPKS